MGYWWRPPSAEHCASQMPSLKAQELGESDAAIVAISRGDRLANSICPLSAHKMRGAILSAEHARKRSPHINGELVVGPEVFEQHADGIASQQQRTGHAAGYYIWVTENGYDLMCRAGVDRQLPQRGWCTIHQIKHRSGTPEQSLRRWATRSPDPLLLPFLLRWR